MSGTPVQPRALSATLAAARGVQVSGDLTLAPGSRLILFPGEGQQLPEEFHDIGAGVRATLQFPMSDFELSPIPVTVTEASAREIELEPSRESDISTQHLLDLLQGGDPGAATQPRGKPMPGSEAIVAKLRQHSLNYLRNALQKHRERLVDHLFDLSSRTQQGMISHNTFYEVMNEIKLRGERIDTTVLDIIERYYADLTPGASEQQASGEEGDNEHLGLVDIREFEHKLACDRIIRAGQEKHGNALEALVIRFAEILGVSPLRLRLPIHVEHLSRAYLQAVRGMDLAEESIPELLNFFASDLLARLDKFYRGINQGLAEQGIRPELEEELRVRGSILKRQQQSAIRRNRAPQPEEPPAESPIPERPESPPEVAARHSPRPPSREADPVTHETGQFAPEALYRSVLDALNYGREHPATGQSQPESTAAPEGAPPLPPAEIARMLADLQGDQAARQALRESGSLREYLDSQGAAAGGTIGAEQLGQIQVIDNLFGTMHGQVELSGDLKPALKDLQVPLARLSMADPGFIADRQHPARAAIDKLAELSASANFPNKMLESRISGIVDYIVDNYDGDLNVFEEALKRTKRLVRQQEQALQRNVERVVRTQQGQETLRRARQGVESALQERIKPPVAPSVLVNLLEKGWRDLMVYIQLREGNDSENWQQHLAMLDTLHQWLLDQQQGLHDENTLAERAQQASSYIDRLSREITEAIPTSVDHDAVLEELRRCIAGEMPVGSTAVKPAAEKGGPEAEEAVRQKVEHLPRLRRWFRRIERLQEGTWLAYTDKQGHRRRMQLAWVSPERDRFVFVNEHGQKRAEFNAVQLARHLSRGTQTPPPVDRLSLVDKSLYETLENVQKSISFARNHDSLTRLINRKTFEGQIERALRHARRHLAEHALLYLDIDAFHLVNEVYDQVAGDQVLLEFARLLSQLNSRKISSARLGGDEFGVLMLDVDLEAARLQAERIASDIAASSLSVDGEKVTFTVSVGYTGVHERSGSVGDVIESGRRAMQQARDSGGNRAAEYRESEEELMRRSAVDEEARSNIQETLTTERFVLQGQPIVRTALDGSAPPQRYYEVLLALKNEDGSLSSPREFIEIAERYGYVTQIDQWVVKETFGWINRLIDAQKVIPQISINLSGISVADDGFMEFLLDQLSEYGVGTSQICFEITEASTISNLVKASDFVQTFRSLGCRMSLDNFGSGMSNHHFLRTLPVDFVKIDGEFVTGLLHDNDHRTMVKSINDLAHFLGQRTVAKSVEDEAVIEALREIGVDYLQGWEVGLPHPLDQITGDLANVEK